ncbi:MAG: alkaline phosphatase family protein [Steroidobacteraceae bacterium]|jgi:phospholipase C
MKRSIMKTTATLLTTMATAVNLLGIAPAFAQAPAAAPVNPAAPEPALTLATSTGTAGSAQAAILADQGSLMTAAKIALLRQNIKYVFVLFQENRSFDHYFGTYPGANGLFATYPGANSADRFSQPANSFSSFNSVIQNVDGSFSTISPFLIPRTIVNQAGATVNLYPEDTYSVDHSHAGYINDMHADAATKSMTQNDGYPLDQEGLHYGTDSSGVTATIYNSNNVPPTALPTLQTKQKGEVVISHIDCDTIPFLWQYADRFTLFDNFHQTATGPSTPNAIAMIAGQTGDTQWVNHPNNANSAGTTTANGPGNAGIALTLPNLTDSAPYPGSINDTAAVKPPYGPDEASNASTPNATAPIFTSGTPQITLTFASLPLSFMGNQIGTIIRSDQHAAVDLIDVKNDIQAIAVKNPNISWGWYQQGYGPEPFDGTPISENGDATTSSLPNGCFGLNYPGTNTVTQAVCNTNVNAQTAPQHASYIVHHNGPQYFGYLGDNTVEQGNMHALGQFYTDVANGALPAAGGVFYVRGGYYNNDGLLPIDPNPNVQGATPGNDDHPNYSDAQISETSVADSINAIANSPYWAESAIIITYDESDGLYDHQPEAFRSYGPDGQPETGGPRIPTVVISPYSAAHTVSHVYSEHSAVIKFIDELFGLTPLGALPNEAAALTKGATLCATNATFCAPGGTPQTTLGPGDVAAGMGDLLEAFDNDRLTGVIPPLPASYAIISTPTVLPHYAGAGCTTLAITPTDYPSGYAVGAEIDPPPLDFNPRPIESAGSPYYNTNNNTIPYATNPTEAAQGTGAPWAN